MRERLLSELNGSGAALLGDELYRFAEELYPICRSITGDGIRETLKRIKERIPLEIFEVPTGTKVFDWEVPREWNIQDGYIKDSQGKRVVDFLGHNLHIVNYSRPIHAKLSLREIDPHLYSIPEHPDWIPYRTSYYKEDWGFCLTQSVRDSLKEDEYEVCIDSTLSDGALNYGECYLPGETKEEVLISVHICHPSLANDNLSGLTVTVKLAEMLAKRSHRFSYRLLFIPGTIGAITWLARNREKANGVRHGFVLTCVGDHGGFHYKKSRKGDCEVDRAMAHILKHSGEPFEIMDFSPYGYDERQYCSPGFDMPMGCLMRSVWGSFPEYHTSADNMGFIRAKKLAGTLSVCAATVDLLEENRSYLNLNPHCEPQLGKRNLYRSTGGHSIGEEINAILWTLNMSDGEHSLLDIADRSGLPFGRISLSAESLVEAGLLALVVND